ncbi:Arylsulfatase A [Arachidicoccus rhizosphaerae]|uniref:Arylsulfatase A n=1 Tax=Arachidicoccus rhizosphaerae TaxID=551991 RepID=A0A1H4BMX1_9BACT|nr:sulfatase-like hydrolase/transferase [Arachidicoccus rhizosphaerae]SEA49525.1 Arylsulfatase A [Arachidicoccus rhizosphaerae]
MNRTFGRKQLVSTLGLISLAAVMPAPKSLYAQTIKSKQPNIIFILTDDQGYGDVGVFFQHQREKEGKPFERSPYLDQLAKSGAMLTDQYSAAPVCAPSRASLMLGVSQGHANVRDNEFDRAIDSNYTMASTLKSLGYQTVAIGKWGLQGATPWDVNGNDWNARPTNRGFDQFFGYMRHMDGHEHYPKEALYFPEHTPIEVWDEGKNITAELDKCYTPDLWTAYAKKWITQYEKSVQKDKPFFMYLAFETPHAVLELPTEAYPQGQGLKGGLQWLGRPGHMINTATGTPDSYMHPDYANATYDDDNDPSTPQVSWPDTYKRYAMSNRRIDYCVGDLMALLKDLKIDDNTIVVFTSDNGPSIEDYLPKGYAHVKPTFFASYGPFDGIKRDNWEGGVRMPVIAAWPGHIPAGQVISSPSVSYDWAPTFIQAAGSVPPERMDGRSLLAELTGHPKKQLVSLIYNEYYFHGNTPGFKEFAPGHRNRLRDQMQLMRLDSFVAVRYNIQSAGDDFEIYNVVTDPGERVNLASQPEKTVKINMNAPLTEPVRTIAELQDYFKARVLQVRRPEKWAKRPYDSALVPAVAQLKEVKKGELLSGLSWKFFKGAYSWIPQTSTLQPAEKGVCSPADLTTRELPGTDQKKLRQAGILALDGYISVPRDGRYTFYLKTASPCFMRLHDMQLIDDDFGYQGVSDKVASVFLKAGLHPLHLFIKQDASQADQSAGANKSTAALQLSWSGPEFSRRPLKKTDLFYLK